MPEIKSLPRKCHRCGCTDIEIYSQDSFIPSSVSEADVGCAKCGTIGSVKVRVVPVMGTFKLNE